MTRRARPVGINHVALEVGDVAEAVALLGRLFAIELRGEAPGMAFLDLGDQFLALSTGRTGGPDDERHFGLVVDDVDAVREAVAREGLEELETVSAGSLGFRDPWGNRFEVVPYAEVQFERTPAVRRALGVEHLVKSESARGEMWRKGLLD